MTTAPTDTTTEALDAVVGAAATAATAMASATPTERAGWLRAVARALEDAREVLVPLAVEESHLPDARLQGELSRTTGQLELLADEVAGGGPWEAVIDHADADWKPVPRPDLRRVTVPLGPVAVYAASNFPFAFSVAGGDTASALAAGCPVVVKAHPGHPRLSVAVAEAVAAGLADAGAPGRGVRSRARVGGRPGARSSTRRSRPARFTGSVAAGRALFDLAAARPEPIPFFGELGSVNPVVVTPAAAAARGAEIGAGYAASLTLGVGQFCTNPGVLFAPPGPGVLDAAAEALAEVGAAPMLNDRIAEGYERGLAALRAVDGVRVVVDGSTGSDPTPTLLEVDIERFAEVDRLSQECFGPVSLVVTYRDPAQVLAVVEGFEGQLTATVHGEADEPLAAELVQELTRIAGRVLWNGWPTGVAVTYAMQHGGPYPAATLPTTSVGHGRDRPVRSSGRLSGRAGRAAPAVAAGGEPVAAAATRRRGVGARSDAGALAEDDRPVPVEEHPVLGVPPHGSGEHAALDVLTERDQLVDGVGVGHALDVLLDDRALVERGGRVVRGRADELDAAIVGLGVGAGALERGQERVVDVDHPAGQLVADPVREDLHVARHHDELDVERRHQLQQPVLGLHLRRGRHGHVVERHAVELGDRGEVGVVRDHPDDVDRQPRGTLPEQQVGEAVRGRRDQHERAQRTADDVEPPRHPELVRDRAQHGLQLLAGRGRLDLHPHEEEAGVGIAELLRLGDVAAETGQGPADRVHDARAVGAGQGEHPVRRREIGAVGHIGEGRRSARRRAPPWRAPNRRRDGRMQVWPSPT